MSFDVILLWPKQILEGRYADLISSNAISDDCSSVFNKVLCGIYFMDMFNTQGRDFLPPFMFSWKNIIMPQGYTSFRSKPRTHVEILEFLGSTVALLCLRRTNGGRSLEAIYFLFILLSLLSNFNSTRCYSLLLLEAPSARPGCGGGGRVLSCFFRSFFMILKLWWKNANDFFSNVKFWFYCCCCQAWERWGSLEVNDYI